MKARTQWEAQAPSNLALIKYLGKKDSSNIPYNASLSYTLRSLITKVKITFIEGEKEDSFKPLNAENFLPLVLSASAERRFLDFFKLLKQVFQIPGAYLIESANNFPLSVGCASSASCFCALTKCAYELALSCSVDLPKVKKCTPAYLSKLSRRGSGSSCRSFFEPWALWEGEGASSIDLPFGDMIHECVATSSEKKPVSSSLAHQKVLSSPAFKDRPKRAEKRLSELLSALKNQSWETCFKIVWDEFQDMHKVYESVGIFYKNEKTHIVLDKLRLFWEKEKDGPLVTMDAGSTVHLLYRADQQPLAHSLRKSL